MNKKAILKEVAKTQTIKLGDLLTDGKFDKSKFNKILLG